MRWKGETETSTSWVVVVFGREKLPKCIESTVESIFSFSTCVALDKDARLVRNDAGGAPPGGDGLLLFIGDLGGNEANERRCRGGLELSGVEVERDGRECTWFMTAGW